MGESFCSIFCGISLLIDEMPSEEQVLKDDFCFSNRIRLQSEISGILTRERLSFSGDINTLKAVLLETPEQNRSFLVEEILRDALSAIENAKGKYNEICCENDKTKKAYINQFITLVYATVMQIVDIRKRMKISLSDVFVSELKKTSDGYYNLICGDDEKNMNADVEGTPKKEDEKTEEKTVYTPELLRLFHKRVKLIDELIGKSDNEIAALINKWAGEKDEFGKPLIENPRNNLRKAFAEALKSGNIISMSSDRFRRFL